MGYVRITGANGVVRHDSRWRAPSATKKLIEDCVRDMRSSDAGAYDDAKATLDSIARSGLHLPIGRAQQLRRPR